MTRTLLLSLLISTLAFGAGADDAYDAAKDAWSKLKKDDAKRKLRHNLQAAAKRFEAVAAKYPKTERAPEALFQAAEIEAELARFSAKDDDVDAACANYRKVVESWPKHRVADDAALALGRLLRDDDPAAARKAIEAVLPTANDKKKELTSLLASLPKAPVRQSAPSKPEDKKSASAPKADEKKPAAPVVKAAAVAEAPKHDSVVAEAIRRATGPLGSLRLPHDEAMPVVQARRAPVPRPEPDVEAVAAPEDTEAGSTLSSLQEKLRDVRVGARPPPNDPKLRNQFKQLVKDEGSNEVSLAQQLGLKVRRVVVDAGHGGHDTGAIGAKGTREKDVALAIALKLAARLEAMGLEVVMTRDDDTFVKLEDRTKIANQQKGDLFISVHCNAAPSRTLRGIETYTLNTSSNRYSIRLSARENATTERGVGDLQYILADLATKANTGESTRLAERVQKSLVHDLGETWKNVHDLGNKEALFFVLLGAKMPAILVETSFISNPEEEERLADEDYQQSIADSVAGSVNAFLEERNKLAQVD